MAVCWSTRIHVYRAPSELAKLGDVHDVDATTSTLVVGATSGGVWTNVGGAWTPISDPGAGVLAQTVQPTMSISSVAVEPGNANTIVFATGVPIGTNWSNDGNNSNGNGVYFTQSANVLQISWQQMTCSGGLCPTRFVKVRFATNQILYALGETALYFTTWPGSTNFTQTALGGCSLGGSKFTDIVVDPNDPSTVYLGVSGQGVYKATNFGRTCSPSTPAPLFSGSAANITNIALAITAG